MFFLGGCPIKECYGSHFGAETYRWEVRLMFVTSIFIFTSVRGQQ